VVDFYAFPGVPLRSIQQSPDYHPGAPSALKSPNSAYLGQQ